MSSQTEKKTRTMKCEVVSDRMEKSRVGLVEWKVKHHTTGKVLKRSTKIMFHDEKNETRVGDFVIVKETKPFSKRKTFSLISKI